jgi:hypothetical protein
MMTPRRHHDGDAQRSRPRSLARSSGASATTTRVSGALRSTKMSYSTGSTHPNGHGGTGHSAISSGAIVGIACISSLRTSPVKYSRPRDPRDPRFPTASSPRATCRLNLRDGRVNYYEQTIVNQFENGIPIPQPPLSDQSADEFYRQMGMLFPTVEDLELLLDHLRRSRDKPSLWPLYSQHI